LRRAGYAIPAPLADTQSFEMAGLLLIAVMMWLCSRPYAVTLRPPPGIRAST